MDTSSSGTNTPNMDLVMHVGTDNLLRNVSFMDHLDVEEGSPLSMHLEVDLQDVFDQIDLSSEYQTKTMDNMPLAMKVANNFQNAIKKE